mgnify:CR=1 FL=1
MKIRKINQEDNSMQATLTRQMADASDRYYNGNPTNMQDAEFDRLYDQLAEAERIISGFAYDISPTVRVGTSVLTELKKARHETPALSLDKVKYQNREKMKAWLGMKEGVISWKLDGLTIVATYDNSRLTQAVTRGDGEEGSIVTHNAVSFHGLPATIPYKGHMVIRGEAPGLGTETGRFDFMEACGIRVVPHETVNMDNVLDKIEEWKIKLPENEFPTDGLVFSYDDQVYADSLGETQEYLGLGETMTRKLMRREAFGCRIGNRLYSNKNLLDKWLEKQCRRAP